MNIADVIPRFALVSGLDNSEIYKWRTLVEDACDYVSSRIKKKDLSENDTKRVEMLCAVYALKLYSLCNEENITSFTAGDVQITSPGNSKSAAEALWREYAEKSADLIDSDEFLFGRVI